MVDSASAGIMIGKLQDVVVVDNTISTKLSFKEVERITTLVVADVIRSAQSAIDCIKLSLKNRQSVTESHRVVSSEVGSGFVHALSMAHNRAKVKGLWTVN